MIDTMQMREAVQDKNYRNVWLYGSTHATALRYAYSGSFSEYHPYYLAVEAARAALRAAISEKDAEIERLKDVIRRVEFVNSYSDDTMCAWCGELEHTLDCPRQKALA